MYVYFQNTYTHAKSSMIFFCVCFTAVWVTDIFFSFGKILMAAIRVFPISDCWCKQMVYHVINLVKHQKNYFLAFFYSAKKY